MVSKASKEKQGSQVLLAHQDSRDRSGRLDPEVNKDFQDCRVPLVNLDNQVKSVSTSSLFRSN